MALNAKPVLKVDANDPTKQWIEFSGQEGMTATPLQYTLTPQQFSAFQAAGLQATRESNNPLYYNQGAFNDAALTRIGQLATPLSGGIGDVGQQAQSRQYLTDWTNILGQYQTKLPTATPATLNDPYADTTLWQKTPYMGGSQVTYIGPKGGPQDPDKGFTGLSNVQAPANIQQASSPVITSQSIQTGLDDLLRRIQTEGITGAKGEVLLAPNSLQTQGGQITPTITAEGLQGGGTKAIQVPNTGTTPNISDSVVAGAEQTSKSIQDYINLLTPSGTSADQQKYNDLMSQIQGLLPESGGRGAAQIEAERQQGVETLKTNLASINGQIQTKLAEYKVLQVANENRPVTMASIIGSERAILNAKAADIELLTATANAIQGNLSVAQGNADRAVSLKYQDIQDNINIRLQQLQLIKDSLNKTDTIRANAITAYLNDQKTQIATQQANEKDLNATKLNIIEKYGAGTTMQMTDSLQTLIQKKLESPVYLKEIKPTGTEDIFAKSENIIQQYKDANISREQIEKQYSDAGKTIPLEVQKSLDKVYPQPTGITTPSSFKWYNPLTWF